MDLCPKANRHVHWAYTPKRAGTGTWILVQRRTGTWTGTTHRKKAGIGTWINVQRPRGTCPGPTHRKGPVQAFGSTSSVGQVRTQGLHSEKGLNRHGDIRPEAYRHVHRAYIPKRAHRSTWILVQRRTGASTGLHTEKGRYRDVQRRTGTCTVLTHLRGPVQARGSTPRKVQARAEGLDTEMGRYRHVDPRPVYRPYTLKRAG